MAVVHNYDTYISYCTTVNGSFTEVGKVKGITPPTEEGSKTEVTHLRSPNFTKEYIASWKDTGEAGFRLYYQRSTFDTLRDFCVARTGLFWEITFPLETGDTTESVMSFYGVPYSCVIQPIEAGDEAVMVEVKIAVSGGVTFTPGTTS